MGLCVRRLLKVGVARSQWNMRVTGSERALQFVPEHFKWYQKRLKIAGAAALTKTVCTPSRVGASACIKDGRGKRGGGFLVRPRCHSGHVSLTREDWNVITRVSFPERFKEKWLMGCSAWLWADLSPQNGSVQIKYPACCPRLQ